jgi:hypothetical protein
MTDETKTIELWPCGYDAVQRQKLQSKGNNARP